MKCPVHLLTLTLINPNPNQDNYDALDDWKRLRAEGKVKIGKDLERDSATSRLGSEVSR